MARFLYPTDTRSKLSWLDEDNIVSEVDKRYWMVVGHEVKDLESAVLERPHDAQLWLKLAYKKLHNTRGYVTNNKQPQRVCYK